MSQPQLKSDSSTSHIRDHVDMIHRLAAGVDGLLVVSAFNASLPKDKGIITHHRVGEVDGMVAAIEAHLETPHMNVYTGLQVMRRNLERGQRGGEQDVLAVLGLVADMDADTGHNAGDYPAEPNYVIETSPGNFQPMWLFERPVAPSIAKEIARNLKVVTGSDHGTADVSHVWRVPGTLNWPNRKKLERGRPETPSTVIVAAPWDGTLTDPTALALAVAGRASGAARTTAVELGELPDVDGVEVSQEAAALLGADDVGDRSSHAARVVEQLAFDGHTAEVAAALFLSATGDWLGRYPAEQAARTDFARLWGKFGQEQTPVATSAIAALTAPKPKREPPVPANDNRKPEKKRFPGVQSSGDFVRDFVPPDYHIDGIAQAAFFYSLTGMTGAGKTAVLLLIAYCTALGKRLGDRDVRKGKVIYSAGENPVDVQMRWIAMAAELGFDPENIDVHFIAGTYNIPESIGEIKKAAAAMGGVDLIIIDTIAAFFQGDDENSNVQNGKHARDMRALTELPGAPCVFTAAHPVKNAGADNLLPRGGGAFLNEVDGNLTLAKAPGGARMHWQGKHRGPEFEPIVFELQTVTAPGLQDSRGRDIPTVMARSLTFSDARANAATARRDEDFVLLEIRRDGKQSLKSMAESLGWSKDGEPDKRRVSYAADKLKRDKLVTYGRNGWKLSKPGEEAATEAAADRHSAEAIETFVAKAKRRYGDDE